jgi:putative spermidine/putrescine transport system ATP-binding protein
MSDRIGVFNKGRLERVGTPQQVYNAPATRFVANFVGAANVLDGTAAMRLAGCASAMLRPERIRVGGTDGARAAGAVRELQYFGAFTRLKVDVEGSLLQADLPDVAGTRWPEPGDMVQLHWDASAVHALDAGPG